jgi:DNA-binding transcriptional regulator YiaG
MRGDEMIIEHGFTDHSFGFPVHIDEPVPVEQIVGYDTPMLDMERLEEKVACAVAWKPTQLTGNEVRFARQRLEETMASFGKHFDVTHAAVSHWEAKGNDPAGMAWSTERVMRLMLLISTTAAQDVAIRLFVEFDDRIPAGPWEYRISGVARNTQEEWRTYSLSERHPENTLNEREHADDQLAYAA